MVISKWSIQYFFRIHPSGQTLKKLNMNSVFKHNVNYWEDRKRERGGGGGGGGLFGVPGCRKPVLENWGGGRGEGGVEGIGTCAKSAVFHNTNQSVSTIQSEAPSSVYSELYQANLAPSPSPIVCKCYALSHGVLLTPTPPPPPGGRTMLAQVGRNTWRLRHG